MQLQHIYRSISTLFLLTLSVSAQGSFVVPVGLTHSPAGATTNFPFGNSTPGRIQYVYDANEIGMSSPLPILGLEVRAQPTIANAAKIGIDLEIGFSTTTVTAATVTTTFASNRGTNHQIVYTRKLTNLPATTPGFIGQYCGPFMFDVPFIYIPAPGEGILVEYDIASQPSGFWPMETTFTGVGPHVPLGNGCSGFSCTSSGGGLGTNLVFTATGGAGTNPAVLVLGDQDLPAPLPLPGAPGCFLYQNTLAFLNVGLTGGTAVVNLPTPQDPTLRGFGLRGQFASIGAQNTLVSTNTSRAIISGPYNVARIHNNTNNTATTGIIQRQVGIVTRFGR